MKLNPLVAAAALLYLIPGLALTFGPQETLGAIGLSSSLLTDWLGQLLGAALLGLALMNWIQRHSIIGGVFGRPLLMTNLLFTTASFFATLRTWRQAGGTPLLAATIALGALAAAFGSRLFWPANVRRRTRAISGFLACSLLLAAAPARAREPLEGTWRGHWVREGSALEVTLRFAKSERGFEGSFDSEALRVTGIPLQKISWNPPEVSWEVVGDATTTTFSGQLRGDAISGQFKEGDAAGNFSFERTEAPPPSQREEITFASGDVRLAGTIFRPAGKGPHPGIVFLHGSGAEGRWASSYLAERFARAGFAALTFDKRGVGQSGGDWRAAGFEELAADAAAAVSALAARSYVAPGRVGIHGHSQGGSIAPLAAARIGDPAFVIASAATGLPMDEMETFSLENALGVGAMSPSDAAEAREFVAAIVATAYHGRPRERMIEVWQKVRDKPWAFEPPAETDSYWSFSKRTAAYDAISLWRQVSAPTLLVFGEADERVPARTSAARIAESYLGGKGTSLKAVFFAGADHTFRLRAAPGAAFAWPKTARGYPDVIIEWALEAVALPASRLQDR